jgi:hypothetical protein
MPETPFLDALTSPQLRAWYQDCLTKLEPEDRRLKLRALDAISALLTADDFAHVYAYLTDLCLHAQEPGRYDRPQLPVPLQPFAVVLSPLFDEATIDDSLVLLADSLEK